jgi:hypothetical protein
MTPLPQLREAMNAIAEKKGQFSLFAMVKRADSPGQWDLVVAAPWLKVGRLKALAELVRLLEKQLGKREVRRFGRIATLEPNSRETRAELAALNIDNTERRFQHTTLFGADVEEAVVLRAKPARAPSDVRASTQRRPPRHRKTLGQRQPVKRARNRA